MRVGEIWHNKMDNHDFLLDKIEYVKKRLQKIGQNKKTGKPIYDYVYYGEDFIGAVGFPDEEGHRGGCWYGPKSEFLREFYKVRDFDEKYLRELLKELLKAS